MSEMQNQSDQWGGLIPRDESALHEDNEPEYNPALSITSIRRIHVEELFGQYNYQLPSAEDARNLSHLFILTGDNGSGKTTLLQLIYHVLSPP